MVVKPFSLISTTTKDFGLNGNESSKELDLNRDFFKKMEAIRIKAGALMGMGDCSKSVTPKFGLLAKASQGGTIAARYFMPWTTHPTMAVTGSQCLASCALTPGTIAHELLPAPKTCPTAVVLEHPMGQMEVVVDYDLNNEVFSHKSAGIVRTCRKLAQGTVFIPKDIWAV